MVKRQKEKQYLSAREQRTQGQSRANTGGLTGSVGTVQKRLPFDCCALTLVPFTTPVCTTTSHVIFDNAALMEFVLKHKRDPVTGDEMGLGNSGSNASSSSSKKSKQPQIIRLNMDRDTEGRWQCPVLTKPFSNQTKIVAVIDRNKDGSSSSLEAYVYSYEAYRELNEKNKNWVDLTTGKKFSPKKDVIILNDPNDDSLQQRRDIQGFWHIQNSRLLENKNSAAAARGGGNYTVGGTNTKTTSVSGNVRHSVTATRIMEKIEKERQEKKRQFEDTVGTSIHPTVSNTTKKGRKILAQDVTGVSLTSGRTASSLTSTATDVSYDNPLREATTEEILKSKFQIMKSRKDEKGYVRLRTNMGDILVELHCDIVPRTCYNFLGLCRDNKYDEASFHRLIPSFMIQCKSTKTEESFFGGPNGFEDEFDDRLRHDKPGILSMANSGKDTNKNQFFITFKPCPHLDRKHSVFGEIVDDAKDASGAGTLQRMQSTGSDQKDRPTKPIIILSTEILSDPAQEADEIQENKLEELAEAREQQRKKSTRKVVSGTKPQSGSQSSNDGSSSSRIGKYLSKHPTNDAMSGFGGLDLPGPSVPKPANNDTSMSKKKKTYGDFSSF
mmetsp:Transcript_41476/g.99378  ORF Transcript_41476/g.99378 Transcript_41476/m.99378 type:complete len:611 (+) Transcript_41476:104-1936(+)